MSGPGEAHRREALRSQKAVRERMRRKRRGGGGVGTRELADASEFGLRTGLPGSLSVISRNHLLSTVST